MNFVFCEWVLFDPLATKQYTVLFLPNSHVNLEPRVSCALHNSLLRAKDGKRQRRQGLNVLAVFPILLSATSCTDRLAPLHKGGKYVYLFYLAWFSRFISILFNNCTDGVRSHTCGICLVSINVHCKSIRIRYSYYNVAECKISFV